MATVILEDLKVRQGELTVKRQQLIDQYHGAHGGAPDAARRRDEIMRDLRALTEEQRILGPKIQEAKEQRKKDRLAQLLRSAEYREAVNSALGGLEATICPWLPLMEMTIDVQRGAVAAPALPMPMVTLAVEARQWLRTLIRLGVLQANDLPPALRSLVEGK